LDPKERGRFAGRRALAALCLAAACVATAAPADRALPGAVAVRAIDGEWTDARRGRTLPVRLRVPQSGEDTVPVILFSHGLGGSREGGGLWGEHWASHGYLVVHLQHPGSDRDLWRSQAGDPAAAARALRGGANAGQLLARVQDVRFVLDEIARRKARGDPDLRRADLSRVGLSGHSFGAQTTLALVGQRFVLPGGGEPLLRDPRIVAAIAFSPTSRERAGDLATQFGSIRPPVLLLTGTRDGDVIGDGTTPAARARVFDYLPPPDKYLAVFEGGDHGVFGGHALLRATSPRDVDIQSGVKALSLAFWDAHLRGDAPSAAWLGNGGAAALLSKGDRYETKP
jgi:predicted dienelactone hydrolase